jgi:hypothetical protein
VHLANQAIQRLGGFYGVEILALDVFDESDFEEAFVGIILNYYRDFCKPGYSCCS